MHRRITLFIFAICSVASSMVAAPDAKPNILFIAIDDLRPELGCYGVKEIHSPNIDRLASSGVQFNRAYCQLAVCNPSRVSVLTGLRPDSTRVWTLDVRFRNTIPDALTLPQHFKNNDYHTEGYGKVFHNPWPDNQSWNKPHSWPEKAQLWSKSAKQKLQDFKKQMKKDGKPQRAIDRLRAVATEIVDIPDSDHIDGAIADQTISAMRRIANKDKPFFLAAGFIRPHLPFVVPKKYWDLYDRKSIPLTKSPTLPKDTPTYSMNTMYELRDYMDFLGTPNPQNGSLTQAQQRELKHGYYASVSLIDAQVGRLMEELITLGIADNTIVVLWSDHGWKLGEHNSWCKQTNYEIDARVPLIIYDPRAKGNGKISQSLVELVDLFPTLCDLTGLPEPKQLEGVSLKPILENPSTKVKEVAISQFPRKTSNHELMGYSMRTSQWRYIEWMDRSSREVIGTELYDHKTDPEENFNLAGQSDQKSQIEKLSKQLWSTISPPPYDCGPPVTNLRPTLLLQNNRKEDLIVYWMPENGEKKQVAKIAPGKSVLQKTTQGHRFLIAGTKSNLRKTITVTKPKETIILAAGKTRPKPDASPTKKPNILFLMADDWSWPHAGALGDPVVKTPTFDRLVREGALFNHAFVSAPSCTPSRHSISSGQYHWRLKDGANLGGSLPKSTPAYPDLLADAGYATGFSRKGTAPSKLTHRGSDPFGARFKSFEEFYQQRKKGQAFCFWYGAGEPHRPYDWQASKRNKMDLDAIKIPACLPDNETVRTDLGDYYLKVERFDRDAARILALLEKNGELDNTIVVMSGDNGMPFPRCKATLYDMGTRVPLVIRWGDKVKGNRKIDDFVSLTDLAPTFLEAAGLSVPKQVTGRSLMAQLISDKNGQIEANRDHVLTGMERHVYPYPSRAIRTKDFLYIRNFSPNAWPTGKTAGKQPHFDFIKTPWPTVNGAFSFNVDPGPSKQWMLENAETGKDSPLYQLAFGERPREELYDLKKDPDQLNNVADSPTYTEQRNQLIQQLNQGLHKTKDPRFSSANHTTFTLKGWTIHLNHQLWKKDPNATQIMLKLLEEQLDRVVKVIPDPALTHLRKVPIWINPSYAGTAGAEYHPDAKWLRDNNRNSVMAKAIEISNVPKFAYENKRMPYLLLHELTHAYHDRVLGFDQPEIHAAFEKARDSKSYEKVKRFTGNKIVTDKAYAMSNHKEYFAENTEAYFGKNDFFPFNKKELKSHDPEMHDVVAKVWGVKKNSSAKQNPSIPSTNLEWKAAASAKATCPPSKGGGAKAPVIFRNNRTTPVRVYWIDFKGKKAQQFTIAPGSRERRLTFAGHSWLVTDDKGASLGHFVASDTLAWADIPAVQIPSNKGNETDAARYPITAPPSQLGLSPFYKKCLNIDGFPILASGKVSDYALREAAYLIQMMLANRPDVLQALTASGSRLTVMAHDEFTTDVPEHSHMGKNSKDKSSDWWDRRARGLGGSETDPVASCGEENLLCFPGDPYSKENILIHEFAHMMHLRGLKRIDPTFDIRLEKIWNDAMAAGLWKDKYGSTNSREYFAEGVQSWFNNNRENDHDHNHVNTRKELIEYDPALASLLKEVFGDTRLVYVKPPERKKQAHLEGYDYSKSPTFSWPDRLKKIDRSIKKR